LAFLGGMGVFTRMTDAEPEEVNGMVGIGGIGGRAETNFSEKLLPPSPSNSCSMAVLMGVSNIIEGLPGVR